MPPTIILRPVEVTIRAEGSRVLVIRNGSTLHDMPWQSAREFARALLVKAQVAEEHERHEQIVFDQALLQRRGVRFGLTSNPILRKMAGHAAFWNRTLRRALPHPGIGSQESIGAPTLIVEPPKKETTP